MKLDNCRTANHAPSVLSSQFSLDLNNLEAAQLVFRFSPVYLPLLLSFLLSFIILLALLLALLDSLLYYITCSIAYSIRFLPRSLLLSFV